MNILFVKFLIFFLLSLGVSYMLFWASYKKKIVMRDVYVNLIFSFCVLIISLSVKYGHDVNNELSSEFKLTKERVSYINYSDSTINDSLLITMLRDLRVPHPKIVFAQAKLESSNYKSELYRSNYNLFGMKYATIRPSVTIYSNMGYQKYDNWKESILDYCIWQFVNNVDKLNDEKYLQYLQAVYAEDPGYVSKIKKIIKNTNFEKL